MIETKRLEGILAKQGDIEYILEMENHKDNREYIWQGTRKEHEEEITNEEYLLLVFLHKENHKKIGYCLCHMDGKSNVFELRRIAIEYKGQGYGREALIGIIDFAFKQAKSNRFWLDVYPDNKVGISLYESIPLVKEGTLRQSYKSPSGYKDQIIYSLLKEEWTP